MCEIWLKSKSWLKVSNVCIMARTKQIAIAPKRARSRSPFGGAAEAEPVAETQVDETAEVDGEEVQDFGEPVAVKTMRPGDGKSFPKEGDQIVMHYSGTLAKSKDKVPFDSSYSRGKPFMFRIGVGEVIRGWDEGITRMSLGEKATLHIKSDFAYGTAGAGCIPPKSDLKFEVELLKIC